MRENKNLMILFLSLCVWFFIKPALAGDKWGMACGFVRDSVTKAYLDDVSITVMSTMENGSSHEEKTNTDLGIPGYYCAKVVIGTEKTSMKFNPLKGGWLTGALRKAKSFIIKATEFSIQVKKEGYKPYESNVPSYMAMWGRAASCKEINKIGIPIKCDSLPKDVSEKILLLDIYLAPENTSDSSFAGSERRVLKIIKVTFDPEQVKKKQKTKVSVEISGLDDPWVKVYWWRRFRIHAMMKKDFDAWAEKMQDETIKKKPKKPKDLVTLRNPDKGNTPTFVGELKIDNRFNPGENEIVFFFDPALEQQDVVLFLTGKEELHLKGEKGIGLPYPVVPGTLYGDHAQKEMGVIPVADTIATIIVEE